MHKNLKLALNLVNDYLSKFANRSDFWYDFGLAFGDSYDRILANIFQNQWQNKTFVIPHIEVVESEVLGTAVGAFAASNNTIYLSANLVNSGGNSLVYVLIEELGHWVDAQINQRDRAGDEGQIFFNLVVGNYLTVNQLTGLKAENDHAVINVSNQQIAVENADFTGTGGNDTLNGTSGDDHISGLAGNDTINGGEGNDTIDGGAGNDTINGGSGNDNLNGGADHDLLILNYSNSPNSVTPFTGLTDNGINGYSGAYYSLGIGLTTFSGIERWDITGGDNADTLIGGKNNDTLKSGAGDDYLDGGGGTDIVDGGNGNDRLRLNLNTLTTAVTLSIGTGNFTIGGVTATSIEALDLTTGSGNDTITGGVLADNLNSGVGNDTIMGLAGNDKINAGDGNDTINAGDGNDTINAGAGDDTIDAGIGRQDSVVGGTGNDLLIINYGNSSTRIYQPFGKITDEGINGYSGSYYDSGNNSSDNFITFSGIERFELIGGSAADTLAGGKNNDTLKGGGGNDYLDGGGGNDYLDGGSGNDTFVFGEVGVTTIANLGIDRIGNFVVGTDKIQLHKSTFSAITTAAGTNMGTNFVTIADDTLINSQTAAIIYSRASGGLFYNADGATSGLGSSGGQFASLPTNLTLSASDFLVVDDRIYLSLAPATVTEDGITNLVYTFTRSGNTINALTVNYTVGGTATLDTDYQIDNGSARPPITGIATFAPNATTTTIIINPKPDNTVEANETVALTLASGTGYSIGTTTAVTGTIVNDDIPPAISITDTTIIEGLNGNPTQALVTLSLNQASSQSVNVNYATANGTALAGTDYTATTGTLTFAAGQTSVQIAIPILNDHLNEANETFTLNLSTPVNATIADSQAIVTITDTLVTSVTTTLPALVENLTLIGTAAINGTGNTGNNIITGNSTNNILIGLDGHDTYVYDADLVQGTDTINETSTGGVDTLNLSPTAAAVNINLGLTTTQTVNANLKLVIPVVAVENFIGGGGNDRITGNNLANTLQGGSGDDRVFGGGGNDRLYGQAGYDTLSGGTGNDGFYYNGSLNGSLTATALFGIDTIADFTTTQDQIVLSKATFSAITSSIGTAIGSNFITVDDDSLVDTQSAAIVYSLSSGGIFYNQNGAATGLGANGGEFANLLGSPTLASTDFTLVA